MSRYNYFMQHWLANGSWSGWNPYSEDEVNAAVRVLFESTQADIITINKNGGDTRWRREIEQTFRVVVEGLDPVSIPESGLGDKTREIFKDPAIVGLVVITNGERTSYERL